jgi:hypothetical protein
MVTVPPIAPLQLPAAEKVTDCAVVGHVSEPGLLEPQARAMNAGARTAGILRSMAQHDTPEILASG